MKAASRTLCVGAPGGRGEDNRQSKGLNISAPTISGEKNDERCPDQGNQPDYYQDINEPNSLHGTMKFRP
jgi:hypothetical protein